MRYSTEPKYRKYVKAYDFLLFARKFGNKYGEKLMNTATKTGIDAAKTAFKWVVQKTAEDTGDLIGNKIADRITSLGKTKRQKQDHTTRKKTANYWWPGIVLTPYKNGIPKNYKLARCNIW